MERQGQFFCAHSNGWEASKKWRGLEALRCRVLASFPNSPPAPDAWPKPSASRAPAITDAISRLRHRACGLDKTAFAQNKSKSHPASASAKQQNSPCAMPSLATYAFPRGRITAGDLRPRRTLDKGV